MDIVSRVKEKGLFSASHHPLMAMRFFGLNELINRPTQGTIQITQARMSTR